jgi:hypothetical protein
MPAATTLLQRFNLKMIGMLIDEKSSECLDYEKSLGGIQSEVGLYATHAEYHHPHLAEPHKITSSSFILTSCSLSRPHSTGHL